MKKRLRYEKLFVTHKNMEELEKEIEGEFQIYGEVEEIKFIPQGNKEQYQISVVIVVA